MSEGKKVVIQLHKAAVYHNINPYKELTTKNYHTEGERVLDNLSLQVNEGELVYLIGRTGSGKSSLLKTLYGELPFFEGEGTVVGFDLKGLKTKQIPILRRNVGVVFQDVTVLSKCNVFENLAFVLRATHWSDEQKISERISEVLRQVGLENMHHKMTFELSGGECQRLMIARALLNNPRLILADEPTGNLDPVTVESIIKLFHSIAATGTAVVIATHNTSFVENYPARTLLFSKGEVKEVEISNQ